MQTMTNLNQIIDEVVKGPLSEQQRAACVAVAETVTTGTVQNFIIEAVAGSGKTYTLKQLIKLIKRLRPTARIIYMVFGKQQQLEAQASIPSELAEVSTFHAKGFGTFRGGRPMSMFKMEGKKVKMIVEEMNVPFFIRGFVISLVEYAKLRGFGIRGYEALDDVAAYQAVIEHYGLTQQLLEANTTLSLDELMELGIRYAIDALKQSNKDSYEKKTVMLDFNDQLYMPLLDSACAADQYDVVLIDEAQDSSAVRRELADKLMAPGAILIAVGDRYQAIMGFAGADNDAMDKIAEKFNAKVLPLTVSFRCPKAVVRFAHKFGVTHIQAADNTPEGEVIEGVVDEDLLDAALWTLGAKDAMVCRNTKPLVRFAYKMMVKGIGCQILGKNIGDGLVKLVNKWSRVTTPSALYEKLEDFRAKQVEKLMKAGKEASAETLGDQIDCLLFLIEAMGSGSTLADLRARINSMFVDEKGERRQVFTMMTIHKSKGSEFKRVFWLGRERFCPSKYAKKAWQKEQETHLMYVAATRAMETLVDVIYSEPEKRSREDGLCGF